MERSDDALKIQIRYYVKYLGRVRVRMLKGYFHIFLLLHLFDDSTH